MFFAGAFYFWRLGDKWAARRVTSPITHHASRITPPPPITHHASRITPPSPIPLLSGAGTLNVPPSQPFATQPATRNTNRFALRLSNTSTPLRQLQRSGQAILLENALLDTTRPAPAIPDQLRAQGDPGSYLVQARGPIDNAFRSLLQAAGAAIVSYIPNNAYLVRASAAVADQLRADPQTQAVLPYEPYYKLKPSLLKLAVAQNPLPDGSALNVLVFADARETVRAELAKLGAQIAAAEEPSPFGPVLRVVPPADSLPAVAALPGVQEVEWTLRRAAANDLSRVRIGVAADPIATNNYLGLTGTNVMVNVTDSGVDATHPDLNPRVFGDSTNTLVDPNGHGTHVAGIIASSGGQSTTVSNASGPQGPYVGVGTQFRGMAPAASLYALHVDLLTGPFSAGSALFWPTNDAYLQETAAQTNAFISNNSWNYVGPDSQTYDLHAASYDAAVRDALPNVPGSQPLLLVFSAGNAGGGSDDGTGGNPDSIQSPGTAKNVITVGAIEQLRDITNNVVWECSVVTGTNSCSTNQPWLAATDSSDQVASFSSRGPVGVGVEGQGRFKPDLVAPGTFVISTRSGQWDTNTYYNPTSHTVAVYNDLVVTTNNLWVNSIFVPYNAVQLSIRVVPNINSPIPFPDLPIYVKQSAIPTNAPGGYDLVRTNQVSLPPDLPLSPVGVGWWYGIGDPTNQPVSFDLITDLTVTNELGNYLQVLEGLNDSLGGYYRYESGTSMAAADVSGTLALMQDFFQRSGRTNSPALMKALLINGARSVGDQYDLSPAESVNSQGWGLINLPTTLPASLTNLTTTANTTLLFDQDPTNALATGQSRTFKIALSDDASSQPLRITLVWTDPPGNPIASVKLVNDLNLIVTNLDTTNLVYFGNDIASGNDFNQAWDPTNGVPNLDLVNNVENVFLSPTLGGNARLGTNYSVTVAGSRVNVNAVTAQPNNVCQDFALVISSGDGQITNAITLNSSSPIISINQPLVTVITNAFASSPGFAGGVLFNQRVGANPQLLGTNTIQLPTDADAVVTLGVTNQWHFYAITNNTSFTNAAFLTFLAEELAVPRMGVFEPTADLATRPEADIDLYVAPPTIPNSYALTNLDPAVVAAADKSLGRGGTETIVYSNATPGVYYLGVKCEDQQAAQYALMGVFSQEPFGSSNSTNGDVTLLGFPTYLPIPDGSPQSSTNVFVMAINVSSIQVRRVIVTNIINHELMSDLLGNLSHGSDSAVLNNHTCVIDATGGCQTWTSYIYDDSDERNVGVNPSLINPHVQHTDGPGSLSTFAGKSGQGQWMLGMVDNALGHVGTNVGLRIFLEHQQPLTGNGIIATIEGNACRDDFIDVPANATSLSITVAVVSATGPVDFTIDLCAPNGGPCKGTEVTNLIGGEVTIDQTDLPPLQVGTYRVHICNLESTAFTVHIRAVFGFSLNTIRPVLSDAIPAPMPILDNAVTDISLTNNVHAIISSLDVGLLISDPRVSDLAITLISPNGTRVLLFDNRGASTTNGLGLGTFDLGVVTNMVPVYTNNFDAAPVGLYAPGATFEGWSVLSNFVDVLDDFTCLCLSNHVLALLDGAVSYSLPTTNAILLTNLNPYTLTYRVNHLPWLEGMVTWWPLDVDGSDIFGGLNGLLLGDVAFSTGNAAIFTDDFAGPGLNPMWQPSLPNAGTGASPTPIEAYAGAPAYSFGTLGTNTILRLSNTLNSQQRRGWSSAATFGGQGFRYEARFNTLANQAWTNINGFIELWILDAANSNRFDVVSAAAGDAGTPPALLAGSSIDSTYNTLSFNYQTNTWYRLVLSAAPNQSVRATLLSDAGAELAGASFLHGTAAYNSGFKIGLSQFMGTSAVPQMVDVAVDYVRLTSGLAGEVNQAYYGDGTATRMVVPRCPALDLGQGRGFSIEGWINPLSVSSGAVTGATVMSDGFENVPGWGTYVAGSSVSGWYVESGSVDVVAPPRWPVVADSGVNVLDINGFGPGTISTNLSLVLGHSYRLSFAFSRNPDGIGVSIPQAAINLDGANLLTITCNLSNAWNDLQWQHTSVVFTASSALSKLELQGLNQDPYGIVFDTFQVNELVSPGLAVPLVEWNDPSNASPQGVQFWLSGLPGTNSPGSLWANIWDTNLQSHIIATVTNALTNGVWQHVALTFGTNTGNAVLYTNGQRAATVNFPASFVPRTSGDLFLGFHPAGLTNGVSYAGGLDEFSLYQRALSPGEVKAIFNAGSRGKYGTNVLVCPVATEVTLLTDAGNQTFAFTNGLTWTNNGPHWETNTISFSTATNPVAIIVRGLNPYNRADSNAANNLNAVVDDFVLSTLATNTVNGMLHFTEDTNLAVLPIKFAPTPYLASNFPPVLIFSNDFSRAQAGLYIASSTIPGGTNSPAVGIRNWTVTQGSVTVVSNAFLDTVAANSLAMATGALQCLLPTIPGHRYQLAYSLRGPCAVGWWNGSVDPLSQRAQDLISGNNGAFFYGATNVAPGFVGNQGFFFLGQTEPPPAQDPDIFPEDTDDPSSSIELGDPPQLQFTNAFTIEGWINPIAPTNDTICGRQQIFFRGYPEPLDCAGAGDPYWLALDPSVLSNRYDLHFHIAGAHAGTVGADVQSTNGVIQLGSGSNGGWWHIAAVFDKPFTNITAVSGGTNVLTITINALRIYVNGTCIATNYTTLSPYQTLDPSLSPGVAIGDRSRYDWTQPFSGLMDELTVYARALTGPEIAAIAAAGANGKADSTVPPSLSLAELSVAVDGVSLAVTYGDNSQWTTHTVEFTALDTNAVLALQSLWPGTLVDGVTLSEVPSELYYLPEVPLSDLYGDDAFGVWTLELWDNRLGPLTTNIAQLLEWQLNFGLAPSNPPPIITLSHGIPYTNSLPAYGVQYFIVPVPQWAIWATNIVQFAVQAHATNPLPVTVFFNQTNYPGPADFALINQFVPNLTTILNANALTVPPLVVGQNYYLVLTNPNPVAVTFGLGVWFDITTLANCQMTMSAAPPAGIPRYLQFDVPTNGVTSAAAPQQVAFWLTGANSNLTVVLSEHLPLPDLDHYDYISQQPCTNDEIVMVLTNSTPFPIQTNRWYVGVFNTTASNVTFAAQACVNVGSPMIIPLTNGVPFVVPLPGSLFAAPPGPPQRFFFDFFITSAVPGVLFEMYNLSGDADLVLQREVPPAMAPYFDGSFFPGLTPEQIVVRTNADIPDLRGHWYLGVYNNETNNVAYTLRAVLPSPDGLLLSAQPLRLSISALNPPHGLLLSWNSVEGEPYFVQYTASIAAPVTWTNLGVVVATTPLTTFEVLPVPNAPAYYRVVQVVSSRPTLHIQLWPTNQVRLSWSTAYPGYTLQSKTGLTGTWANAGLPVTVVGTEFVAFDAIGPDPKYYRLIK
jgi:subtilisin-like proprotein convertase family protein